MNRLMPAAIAELIGTFALTFVGAGAIIMTGGENLVAIALAHGLILGVAITATMHISGGQINPAVSIALCAIGKQSPMQTVVFIAAQVIGAVVGAGVLRYAMEGGLADQTRLGATLGSFMIGEKPLIGPAFVLETVGTFLLMFAVIGTAVDSRGVGKGPMVGGFGIGLTLTAVILFIGPATGASVNPARSFGPALIGGHWDAHWLYWLAPIIGASLAALVWQYGIGLREEK